MCKARDCEEGARCISGPQEVYTVVMRGGLEPPSTDSKHDLWVRRAYIFQMLGIQMGEVTSLCGLGRRILEYKNSWVSSWNLGEIWIGKCNRDWGARVLQSLNDGERCWDERIKGRTHVYCLVLPFQRWRKGYFQGKVFWQWSLSPGWCGLGPLPLCNYADCCLPGLSRINTPPHPPTSRPGSSGILCLYNSPKGSLI